MKHDLHLAPATPAAAASSVVTVLHCGTTLAIDPEPLTAIFAAKGAEAAEETICRVLEDLATRLNALNVLRARGAFAELVRPAQRVSAIARQIGLTEAALAAGHVANAAEMGDAVALEATLHRLERGFDAALCEIWDVGMEQPL